MLSERFAGDYDQRDRNRIAGNGFHDFEQRGVDLGDRGKQYQRGAKYFYSIRSLIFAFEPRELGPGYLRSSDIL